MGDGVSMPLTAAAHEVQQALHFGVIVDDLAIAPDVDEVVRVQPVVLVDVDLGVAIAQGKDHPRLQTQGRICRYYGVHTVRHMARFAMCLNLVEQVHAEVVEPQVSDGHAGFQVFQLDHLLLKAAQLFFAVGDIVGLCGEHVVVAGRRHVGDHHPAFNPLFQVDVFVERDVGPIVHQLDAGVGRADTIHTPKALNDADRVPVDVVVDQVVAVLKVLAFGYAARTC